MAKYYAPNFSGLLPLFDGKSAAGGKLYAYRAGSSIPAPIFNEDGVELGSWVSIDSNGCASFLLDSALSYKLIVKDALGAVVGEWDNVKATNAPGGMDNPMTAPGDLIVGGTGGTGEALSAGNDGQMLSPYTVDGVKKLGWKNIPAQPGDHLVKASATDASDPGSLNDKLAVLSPVVKNIIITPQGDEKLLLGIGTSGVTNGYVLTKGMTGADWAAIPTQTGDHQLLVSATDAAAGYLGAKLVPGSNITLTPQTDGDGVQTLEISATGGGGGGGSSRSFCEPFGQLLDGYISLNMGSTASKIAWFGRTPLRNTKIKSVLVGTFGVDTNPYSELGVYAMRSNRALTLIDKVTSYTLTSDGSQFFEFSTPVAVGNEIIFIGSLCATTLTWRNTSYTIMQTTANASLISQMQKTSGVFLDANKYPVIAHPFTTTPNEAQQNVCSRRGFYWPNFTLSTLPASTTTTDWHVTGSFLILPYVAIETIS